MSLAIVDGYQHRDVFVRDRLKNITTKVNVAANSQQANASYSSPCISADGRYVGFLYLVAGDTNTDQVFVHDQLTKQTELVSISSEGKQGNSSSGLAGCSLSADGRYIAFISEASNLVPKDTNHVSDTFLHDRLTHKTERVSVSSNNVQGNLETTYTTTPVISEDGRFVAFQSAASNVVNGDTNKYFDVFLHDRLTHKTERISISSNGKQGNEGSGGQGISLSADGRYVAFASSASNLDSGSKGYSGIYIRDRLKKKIKYYYGYSLSNRSLSADGRYLAASNGEGHYGIHDTLKNTSQKIDVSSNGEKNNLLGLTDLGAMPSISGDGRYISFKSSGTNLVAKDTNGVEDIFVRDHLLDNKYHADLKITPTTKPVALKPNTQGAYLYTITNNGKDAVPDVSLIHLVSGGSAVSFKPSQGTCSVSVVETVCHLGKLAAGKKLTLSVTVKAQTTAFSQQVTVSGAPVDVVPGNNQISVVTPVK
jgi:hypothetical protein